MLEARYLVDLVHGTLGFPVTSPDRQQNRPVLKCQFETAVVRYQPPIFLWSNLTNNVCYQRELGWIQLTSYVTTSLRIGSVPIFNQFPFLIYIVLTIHHNLLTSTEGYLAIGSKRQVQIHLFQYQQQHFKPCMGPPFFCELPFPPITHVCSLCP